MEAWKLEEIRQGLRRVVSRISISYAKGNVLFDGDAPVRQLATASLRGLAGHLLTETAPHLTKQYFKPGQGSHIPPAYLFQPLFYRSGPESGFPFRIVTWDREREFLPALIKALRQAAGRPFAESGARVSVVKFDPPEEYRFSGREYPDGRYEIFLHTPVRIKKGGGWVSENEINLGYITLAAVNRLNILSEFYGSGEKIDPLPFMAEASLARELARKLVWEAPRRRSSSQCVNIALSGVVGSIYVRGLPPAVLDLLSLIRILHIGRHTSEGCGHVICARG